MGFGIGSDCCCFRYPRCPRRRYRRRRTARRAVSIHGSGNVDSGNSRASTGSDVQNNHSGAVQVIFAPTINDPSNRIVKVPVNVGVSVDSTTDAADAAGAAASNVGNIPAAFRSIVQNGLEALRESGVLPFRLEDLLSGGNGATASAAGANGANGTNNNRSAAFSASLSAERQDASGVNSVNFAPVFIFQPDPTISFDATLQAAVDIDPAAAAAADAADAAEL